MTCLKNNTGDTPRDKRNVPIISIRERRAIRFIDLKARDVGYDIYGSTIAEEVMDIYPNFANVKKVF